LSVVPSSASWALTFSSMRSDFSVIVLRAGAVRSTASSRMSPSVHSLQPR